MNRLLALAFLLLVSFPPFLYGQSTNASLMGRITDPSKAAIADARLVAIDTDTNVRYETTSNTSGEYSLANLPPGPYRLEIEKTGCSLRISSIVDRHQKYFRALRRGVHPDIREEALYLGVVAK